MFLRFRHFREVYLALGFLVFVIVIGTVGYRLIDDISWFNSFYMCVITVSTVGFSEVENLSQAGRAFTAVLILVSFGTFAFAISSIARYVVSGEYKQFLRYTQLEKEIENLNGHVLVCGYGRNGSQAAKRLKAHNTPVVILENDPERCKEIGEHGFFCVEGDATNEEVLFRAGINTASALITTLPKDSDNLFVVLTARDLRSDLTIISRASADSTDRKLRIAGADNVIMPDKVGGDHMASLVVTPDVVDFLDQISIQGSAEINLEEIEFHEIPSNLRNKKVSDLEASDRIGIKVIGIKTPEGQYLVNPSPDHPLVSGSKFFVLGTSEQIRELNDLFGVKEH